MSNINLVQGFVADPITVELFLDGKVLLNWIAIFRTKLKLSWSRAWQHKKCVLRIYFYVWFAKTPRSFFVIFFEFSFVAGLNFQTNAPGFILLNQGFCPLCNGDNSWELRLFRGVKFGVWRCSTEITNEPSEKVTFYVFTPKQKMQRICLAYTENEKECQFKQKKAYNPASLVVVYIA